MHIQILQVTKHRKIRSNKDTNGGYGTVNDFGRGMVAVLLKYYKSKSMRFPEILPAYVHAILKNRDTSLHMLKTNWIRMQILYYFRPLLLIFMKNWVGLTG